MKHNVIETKNAFDLAHQQIGHNQGKNQWLEKTSIESSKTEIPRYFKNGNYKTE